MWPVNLDPSYSEVLCCMQLMVQTTPLEPLSSSQMGQERPFPALMSQHSRSGPVLKIRDCMPFNERVAPQLG